MSFDDSKSPVQQGFYLPAEWEEQKRTWLSWLSDHPAHWGGDRAKRCRVEEALAKFAAEISHFQTVAINAPLLQHKHIQTVLNQARADLAVVELFDHVHDDVWCRDHGPLFLKHETTAEVVVSDWEFNAWGEKFSPWDKDNQIPAQIAESLSMRRFVNAMVLEGGAIEVNSSRQLLTTEAVLLHPNRNPHLQKVEIEENLRQGLGVKEILWLGQGIEGDDTDGHVDDLARFVGDSAIVACREAEAQHPNYAVLEENWQRLQTMRTSQGGQFDCVAMPMPSAIEIPGWRLPVLPASYVNFLFVNGAILMPSFRQRKQDEYARDLLQELCPQRQVIAVDALDLVEEGGSLHCLSMQQPL